MALHTESDRLCNLEKENGKKKYLNVVFFCPITRSAF